MNYIPIIVAMKSVDDTYANNAAKWGVAGLNVDGGRVGTEERVNSFNDFASIHGNQYGNGSSLPLKGYTQVTGRYPANLIHDNSEAVLREFDKAGNTTSSDRPRKREIMTSKGVKGGAYGNPLKTDHNGYDGYTQGFSDNGTPARFFQACPPDPPDLNPCLNCNGCTTIGAPMNTDFTFTPNTVYQGDCIDVMRQWPDNIIDTIITDPPYALTNRTPDVKRCVDCKRVLGGNDGNPVNCPRCGGQLTNQRTKQQRGFMGKEWDNDIAFSPDVWIEALRIAKPGATLMAFGGTRTHHRLMCAIEDAGWEIRDVIMWVYGSGFPKSLDIGKALDKGAVVECPECINGWVLPMGEDYVREVAAAEGIPIETAIIAYQVRCGRCDGTGKVKGAEREVNGTKRSGFGNRNGKTDEEGGIFQNSLPEEKKHISITSPTTDLAKQFEGYGTALKPAYEIVIVVQKNNPNLPIDVLLDIMIVTNLQILCEVLLCLKRCQESASNAGDYLKQLQQQLKEVVENIVLGNVLDCLKERELLEFVNSVRHHLNLLKVKLNMDMESIAPDNVRENGKNDLQGKITLTGTAEDLQGLMDTLLLMLEGDNIDLSMTSLWNSILGDVLSHMNKFTILMKSEMITDLKTLNWLLYQNISENIIQQKNNLTNGFQLLVSIADYHLNDVKKKYQDILKHIVQEGVTGKQLGDKPITPAYEPIIVAQKPIDKNYANNAEKWGVSGLNIDGGRVGMEQTTTTIKDLSQAHGNQFGKNGITYPKIGEKLNPPGRYPANLIQDGSDGVMEEFDKAGERKSGGTTLRRKAVKNRHIYGDYNAYEKDNFHPNDTGTPARFFYCAKASPSERQTPGNSHPTQKPLTLMRYLTKLTRTPTGGIVLDMFGGSGTTALAAIAEKRPYVIIEKEANYAALINTRIAEYTAATITEEEIKLADDTVATQQSLW